MLSLASAYAVFGGISVKRVDPPLKNAPSEIIR